ncbi:sigma factor G inhibitor Gin [Bacillaceae bacterium Marseille-Q3522]|nr:sigma factor G inhibitor Gin [Bacillaceae bacterium Marseille-Q3522]
MEVEKLHAVLTNKQSGETCIICEVRKAKGIHLYMAFICTDCEKQMLTTDTSDPKYKYYLEKLRRITMPEIFS